MENYLFEKSINRVNFYLKLTGLSFQISENPTCIGKIMKRWLFYLNWLCMNSAVFSFIAIINKLSVREICYMWPCLTLCCLANFKAYDFYKNFDLVLNLVETLKNLQNLTPTNPKSIEEISKWHKFLFYTNNLFLFFGYCGIVTFFFWPIGLTISNYLKTKEIKLFLPFILWCPYDAYDLKYWPYTFVYQFWSACVAVFLVYGPDCFYYTCCVFIHIQFKALQDDVHNVQEYLGNNPTVTIESIIHRHREIIRCVEVLQTIYGKSTLFNLMSSSIILCLNGFNIMIFEDLMMIALFTPFFVFGSIQVYLFCYYGDLIMRDSLEINEAMYNSKWYELDASAMKYCLFIILRTQKACKITAYGYSDVNMRAFARILSWAWSYFTLLRSIYVNKNRN